MRRKNLMSQNVGLFLLRQAFLCHGDPKAVVSSTKGYVHTIPRMEIFLS